MKYLRYLAATSFVALLVIAATSVKPVSAQIVLPTKVTICHATNSVKNAYVQLSVDVSAVDGVGNNDHTHHTGPVASTEAEAQAYKDAKIDWGDIIPDAANGGFGAGLNWDAKGQAVYNNNCNGGTGITEVVPAAVTFNAPTCNALGSYVVPTTANVTYQVNSATVAAGTYTVPNGSTVTVDAVADAGYYIDSGTTDSWTNTFQTPTGCGSGTPVVAQVSSTPTGSVKTGGGGANQTSKTAAYGFAASTTLLGIGLALRKRLI